MKKVLLVLLAAGIFGFVACGESSEQKASKEKAMADSAMADSIAAAQADSILKVTEAEAAVTAPDSPSVDTPKK